MDYAKAAKSSPPSEPSQSSSFSPQVLDPAPYDDERPIWIYVDDSNIWISAKKLAATVKKLKTKEDHRVRIDVGRLADVVARTRPIAQGFLYGSEPPPVDTVWEKIKDRGWEVYRKKRSTVTGKEKGVDGQMVADITERACDTPPEKRTTIVIISGDADVKPAIDKVLKHAGWKVEVCMWKDAMSAVLKRMSDVQVDFLDEFIGQITFTSMKFDIKNHPHLLSLVKASGVVLEMEPTAFPNRVPTKKWCNQLESITQWPFQHYWLEDHGEPTNNLVLVFSRDSSAGDFDITGFLKKIEEYPVQYVRDKQPYLKYAQKASGLSTWALETYGHLSYDDACSDSDNEPSFVSDEKKDWKLKRRLPHRHQRYSEPCIYKFICKDELRCRYNHTEDEKAFFRTNPGVWNPYRKVKPCLSSNCRKESKDCPYAHGDKDAVCLNCRTRGHFTESCQQ